MASQPTTVSPSPPNTRAIPWTPLLWFAGLFLLLHFATIRDLVQDWITDEDMGHGFFVPLVAGYIIWQRRDTVLALESRPHWSGYVVMLGGFLFLLMGVFGAEFFISRVGMLLCIAGLTIALHGYAMLRELAFPLLLLPFMVRIPAIIYSQITLPLQLLASSLAEQALSLLGVQVFREGNILELPSQKLSVVEACSGIRSLLSLSFLSLVYGYFFDPDRIWIRWTLFFATVPIAIGTNAFRVTMTGLIGEWNPELAAGFFHTFEGWMVFMLALALLLATHQILKRLEHWLRPSAGA